jgi:alpha-D-ribose 1-methylphosphonate 5-triphosphate synthase subunit PhnL
VGKSGSGKSKLLELLIKNDILNGRGVGVLDPHGDLVDNVLIEKRSDFSSKTVPPINFFLLVISGSVISSISQLGNDE